MKFRSQLARIAGLINELLNTMVVRNPSLCIWPRCQGNEGKRREKFAELTTGVKRVDK